MNGKVLKVFNNNLYGETDEREVILFAAFVHKKYMNKYAIFTFNKELDKNKLYFGSIHMKENSLVTFKVKNEEEEIINSFLSEYENDNLEEFELIDITSLSKIEFVGYNTKDYLELEMLKDKSIPKGVDYINDEYKKKNPVLKIFVVLLLLAIGFLVYWYLNTGLFKVNTLKCTKSGYNSNIKLDYDAEKTITFNDNGNVKNIKVIETYKFKSVNSYNNFKNESKHYMYFNYDGNYKYIDETLELKIFYSEENIIKDYEKIKYMYMNDGYTCEEVKDEK